MQAVPFLLFATLFYWLYLFIICRRVWRRSGRKFVYSILDIWAFILGFTPSLWLVGYIIQHGSRELIAPLILMFFGQIGGFFIAIVDKGSGESGLTSAVGVFLGTLGGLGLALGFVLVVWAGCLALLVLLATLFLSYGLVLIPLALVVAAILDKGKKPKVDDQSADGGQSP
jgi:hypothetical protein